MQQDPKEPRRTKQPEDGTNEDLNLTNNDATLLNNERNRQPDASTMSDQASTDALNDNMVQSARRGDEINPEYGDAADPTIEKL
jgi:hypothetical protein